MDPITIVRPNGSGFMHVQRSLQPGENIPVMPSLVTQLLACRLTRADDFDELETPDIDMDEMFGED
jgi:hypothetical protein